MAIVKIQKRENRYLQIDKEGINDGRLSWAATGLLTYLIARPDDWQIILTHLAGVKKDKRDATRTALNELREHNYCHYFEFRENGKVRETTYLIFEIPTDAVTAASYIVVPEGMTIFYKECKPKENKVCKPKTENAISVKPLSENPTLLIQDNTNTDITDKRIMIHEEHDMTLFENLFKDLGVNFTKTNQASVKRLLKSMKLEDVKNYLLETHTNLKNNPEVTSVPGAFSKKIAKGERQPVYKAPVEKATEVAAENKVSQEKAIKTAYEGALDHYRFMQNKNEAISYFKTLTTNNDSELCEKYLKLLLEQIAV